MLQKLVQTFVAKFKLSVHSTKQSLQLLLKISIVPPCCGCTSLEPFNSYPLKSPVSHSCAIKMFISITLVNKLVISFAHEQTKK